MIQAFALSRHTAPAEKMIPSTDYFKELNICLLNYKSVSRKLSVVECMSSVFPRVYTSPNLNPHILIGILSVSSETEMSKSEQVGRMTWSQTAAQQVDDEELNR
ncbi:hypothetical protein EVAR_45871_1 [Eumeta japonica]|uniref:Uncharacterized protein n=1 Tax=Eumeta variegata TaxID=151549 RepID=A0A4C1WL79_EUMVA|nr:hypothetical protein EVAR_45871_1 [Eumeta japonica]